MSDLEEDYQLGAESEEDDCELSDGELQEALSSGLLKPGMNVPLEEPKRAVNNVEGLRKCLAEFKKNLVWAERLDITTAPAVDLTAAAEGKKEPSQDVEQVDANDDFQREMYFPNAKRKYKDSKFGFGGKKKGNKWNTKESYDDMSGFRAKVAHGKVNRKFSKGGKKNVRHLMGFCLEITTQL
ncbi:putative rRNA-processing protein EBP2 [Bagarius yarrelli]|uniref:Putative rRNA-processing protein EBP2 n=1 Tax=Bagarius yarrelli TaxID=175774 RepID=A0A556TZS0_BAGYA|nr:putative rRNA-processing protein EBP2 [Bagarius yarrelli]